MFDNKRQSIPSIFIEKIEIDKVVDSFKKLKVIAFSDLPLINEALKKQKDLRRRCQLALAIHKVDQNGPGGAGSGEVYTPFNTNAIAA